MNKDEGFLNDADRERLKSDGLELANGTMENLYEENFNIYKVFTTAEREIYLSYASSDEEGRALRPSILVNKIKKIFPSLEEESAGFFPWIHSKKERKHHPKYHSQGYADNDSTL